MNKLSRRIQLRSEQTPCKSDRRITGNGFLSGDSTVVIFGMNGGHVLRPPTKVGSVNGVAVEAAA